MLNVAEMMLPLRPRLGLLFRISEMDSLWSPMTAVFNLRRNSVLSEAPAAISELKLCCDE